jgi:hypothetical protein
MDEAELLGALEDEATEEQSEARLLLQARAPVAGLAVVVRHGHHEALASDRWMTSE